MRFEHILLGIIVAFLLNERYTIEQTVTINNIQFIYIEAFHLVTYTIHTNWNLSHIHTDIQSHTPYTQTRTSLTVIQTFSHIHNAHKLEPLTQSYRHSVTYTIHKI